MPVTFAANTEPGKNEPCPCGSKLKYKRCHGDPVKKQICMATANETMADLILIEQKRKGVIPWQHKCNHCGNEFEFPKHGMTTNIALCPECDSTDIEENKNESEKP